MKYDFTREKLLELHYEQNLTTVEIAKIYGCNRNTILSYLKKFGVIPRGKIKKPLPNDLINTLVELYVNQKLSTRQIGKIIGKDHQFVSRKLTKIGIDVEDRISALRCERNPCWKNGKTINNGYVQISTKKDGKYKKREHQIIMENYIGRELKKGEVVHHIDGDKSNNNINNLALMDITAHTRLHALERWKKKKENK